MLSLVPGQRVSLVKFSKNGVDGEKYCVFGSCIVISGLNLVLSGFSDEAEAIIQKPAI